MNDEPLIYTINGNLPISSLECRVTWIDNQHETRCTETYTLNGEVVKQAVHILGRKTLDIIPEQEQLS